MKIHSPLKTLKMNALKYPNPDCQTILKKEIQIHAVYEKHILVKISSK